MRKNCVRLVALLLPVLTGCLSHTRKLAQPRLAGPAINADAMQLVRGINDRYNQIQSFTAEMDFAASVGGAKEGKQTDYTAFQGFVLFRKAQMLRVLIKVPVVHTTAVDLGSNGKTFTLLIPSKNHAIQGDNSVTRRVENPSGGLVQRLENLRPNVFLDSMLVQPISPDQIVSVINESESSQDPKTKQLIELPEYDLSVLSEATPSPTPSPGPALAKVVSPRRVIRFSRVDLLPVEQDIYNGAGDLETQAIYGPYKEFNGPNLPSTGVKFPTTIEISRPADGYKIRLTVEKLLSFNQPLGDEQFEVPIPQGTTVQKLE